jgi:hypothetical protein
MDDLKLSNCGARHCDHPAQPGQAYCSLNCAYVDSHDSDETTLTWVSVSSWDDIDVGSEIKAVIGEEVFVGPYFNRDDQDARFIIHQVTSVAVGDVGFGDYAGAPTVDELYVGVRGRAEREARAGRDIQAAFGRDGSPDTAAIARAADLSIARATEMGL